MSILATIPAFILNNIYALNELLGDGVESYLYASQQELYAMWRNWAYLASYDRDASRPEHVFEERWEMFQEKDPGTGHSVLAHALNFLGDDYLEEGHGRIHIRTYGQFEHWQNLHARMTLMPVVETKVRRFELDKQESERLFPYEPIIYPYNMRMEDYIARVGLNETHLHINLCISAEEMWLVCLYHAEEYEQALIKVKSMVEPMLHQLNPQLNIPEHIARIRLAKTLRQFILDIEAEGAVPTQSLPAIMQSYCRPYTGYDTRASAARITPIPIVLEELLAQERHIWRRFSELTEDNHAYYALISTVLHLYILLMNEFVSLARYRDNQIGLQEFCKTSGYPRNLSTKTLYTQAFRTCTRHIIPHAENKVEVRFNPASNLAGKCLDIINGAYRADGWKKMSPDNSKLLTLLRERELPYSLILVGHLIKKRRRGIDNTSPNALYKEARKRYLREIRALIDWHRQGKHKIIPIGLDVAGSEVSLPVDVFVPAYKAYSLHNKHSRTIHCGEDFRHLITGMRAVYDAIHLLDFIPGNRIGHAVALGILPDIWLDAMPGKIVITRREWLLNLIFCRSMYLRYGIPESDILYRVEEELAGCSAYVFEEGINLHTLSSLYEARALIPEMVCHYLWLLRHRAEEKPPETSDIDFDLAQQEIEKIKLFELRHGMFPLRLFCRWEEDEIVGKRLNERIEIDTDFLDKGALLLLQQHMQRFVKERGVIIESLPVSNYRIAPYKRLKYLHTLRWMQVPGCRIEGDTEMDICLGSDDPGIFASDIKAEYYHLFCMMKEYGLSDEEAVAKLDKLNQTGRIYSFEAIKVGFE